MGEIRAFIAIELPIEVTKKLEEAKRDLSKRLPKGGIRWVKSENIHLTLRFLGNVAQQRLVDIYEGLDQLAAESSRFSLDLGALGCFPNPRRPRVIWIGLGGGADQLGVVQDKISQMLLPMGWEEEGRSFHPHLTLGRVKNAKNVVEARFPWGNVLVSGCIEVTAVHLIESQLLPQGAEYTIRHSAHFIG
jgi:2'-5' RNA ligase